jgi:hypothetical protein
VDLVEVVLAVLVDQPPLQELLEQQIEVVVVVVLGYQILQMLLVVLVDLEL